MAFPEMGNCFGEGHIFYCCLRWNHLRFLIFCSYYDVFVSFAFFFFLLVEDYHGYNIDKCPPGNEHIVSYPTKREKENHRLKSAWLVVDDMLVPWRVIIEHLSNEKYPCCLGYIRDCTTQLYDVIWGL